MGNIHACSTKKEKSKLTSAQKENIYICSAQNYNIKTDSTQKGSINANPNPAQNGNLKSGSVQKENVSICSAQNYNTNANSTQKASVNTKSVQRGTIANSAPKEIIIKCSIEEMMKAFFKDYALVWHDPNVKNKENQQYIAKLKKYCEVFTFTEWQKASIYTKEAKTICHVITSGTNGELLANEICKSQSVAKIYVFCGNKEYHSSWAQKYERVSCVETEIEAVLLKIQQNLLEWYKEASSRKLNLPAFAPIFDDHDKSEVNNLHRFLKVIPNFKNREQAKEDFVKLSRQIYSDKKNAKFIEEFERGYNEYDKEQALRWYTRESFLYKVANNCLRIATSDSIQYCRLILRDIEQAIKDQYRSKSKNFNGLLYRGAYLSQEEWSHLKQNQEKEIEMHGFLSVSKEKHIALNFMKTDPSKKVFITIIVPKGPNEEEQGFAEIEEFSDYAYEKEILFNVRSRFTVLETEDDYVHSANFKCRHLVLLYGAQGFRQLIKEKNPIREVLIPSVENTSCARCKTSSLEMRDKTLFVSLADSKQQVYYCKKCLNFGKSPFLCISTLNKVGKSDATKIKGCTLRMNSNQEQIPFYGPKCCNCQAKKRKAYFTCADCNGKKNKWCEDCFEKVSKCREIGHQNIILETTPFSFWCEQMSANELSHLKFQEKLVQESAGIFEQARMYLESHRYEEALKYYTLYIQKNEAKGEDANLATSYNYIGLIHSIRREHKKALEFFWKALKTYQSVYGEDNHPEIAATYNNIGGIYKFQRDYKKALECFLKSVEIDIVVHGGENHSDIATSINNVASVFKDMGDYKQALVFQLKALEIEIFVHGGDNNPAIATALNNIGMIYKNLGDHKTALEYQFKSLDIKKSLYGDNDPLVAASYENMGSIYQNQGDDHPALECHLKSLAIRKSVFGDNHPSVANSYENIGVVYEDQGDYHKALECHLKSLEIRKSIPEDSHLLVRASYRRLGVVYHQMGEKEKSAEYVAMWLGLKEPDL